MTLLQNYVIFSLGFFNRSSVFVKHQKQAGTVQYVFVNISSWTIDLHLHSATFNLTESNCVQQKPYKILVQQSFIGYLIKSFVRIQTCNINGLAIVHPNSRDSHNVIHLFQNHFESRKFSLLSNYFSILHFNICFLELQHLIIKINSPLTDKSSLLPFLQIGT